MVNRLSGEIFIRRTPEDVFDFVADESNEPRYNPAMLHVRTLTDGPVGVGTRYLATMGRGRHQFRMTIEMTGYERPARLGSRTTMSMMDVEGEVTFTPAGRATRLRWDWDVQLKGWARLVGPLALRLGARNERQNWRRLKRHLEQRNAAPQGPITIATAAGLLPVYLAVPEGTGPWPAVVVVHDALGMSEDLCRQADWLATQGFLAAAPDLFQAGASIHCLVSAMRQVRSGAGSIFDDIEATRTWLTARDDCTGSVGVVGFCFGGGLALLLAPTGRYGAAAVNYGTSAPDAFAPASLRASCPIVASYGRRDRANRRSAARLEAGLSAVGVDHDVKEYRDAGHGFLNDHDGAGDRAPLSLALMARLVPGQGYDEAAAADARQRISSFLHRHLDGGPERAGGTAGRPAADRSS